ncbi:MAG: AI-2E family transporter [Bacteroidia bacterium]|nr:AI-2E family transporter [Bacteroidia bacterium]
MIAKTHKPETKQLVAFIILIIAGLGLFILLYDYFVPFLGALIFYIMFFSLMKYFVEKKKWQISLAAISIIFISLVVIVAPVILFFDLLYNKLFYIIQDPASLLDALHILDAKIKSTFGVEIIDAGNMAGIKTFIGNLIPGVLNKLAGIIASLLFMYFILYFLLINYKELYHNLCSFLPFEKETIALFNKEMYDMTLSNVIITPMLATLQGLSAVIAFYFLGLPDSIFWGSMCGIFSFIPMVGSAIIWLPAAIYLMITGKTLLGLILVAYGVLIIASLDNVIRMMIQKKFADVHPLITIFGVLIGLDLFGLPGLIFGPLLLSFFAMGIRIYRKSYLAEPSVLD